MSPHAPCSVFYSLSVLVEVMEEVVLGDAPESQYRCKGSPATLPDKGKKYGNLGKPVRASECSEACLKEPECGFAVFMQYKNDKTKGICTAWPEGTCEPFKAKNKRTYQVWKKVAEAPWSVAEWAVALRFHNPRATVLVLVLDDTPLRVLGFQPP